VVVNKFMDMVGHIVLSLISPSQHQGERLDASAFSSFSEKDVFAIFRDRLTSSLTRGTR
jgi:hypothetical protein